MHLNTLMMMLLMLILILMLVMLVSMLKFCYTEMPVPILHPSPRHGLDRRRVNAYQAPR